MTTRIDEGLRVADVAALTALSASSVPPRVDGGIYFVDDAGSDPLQGRWAQYRAGSMATVGDNVLMPDDEVGRWHWSEGGAGGDVPDGLLDAAAHAALEPADCHPPKAVAFTGDPAAYSPAASGQLVVATDTDTLYRTTGTAAGALVEVGGGSASITGGTADPTSTPPTTDPETDGVAQLYVQTGVEPTLFIGLDSTGAIGYNGWGKVAIDIAGGGGPYDAYAARLTGTYSGPELAAIEALFTALAGRTIAAGGTQLDSLQVLCLRFMDNVADSRLNLKGTSYTITDVGSGVFTAREGMALDGASDDFTAGFNPSVISASVDGVVGAYLGQNAGTGVVFGGQDGFGRVVDLGIFGASFFGRMNSATGETSLSYSDRRGAITVTRTDTLLALTQNQSTNSTSPEFEDNGAVDTDIFWGSRNNFGSESYLANQFRAVWAGAGKGWTEAETEAFHADIETCADVFGAGVIS